MNVCSSQASASAEKIPVLAGNVKVLSNDFLSLPTPLIHVAIFLATDLNNMFRQHWKHFHPILQQQWDLCIWKGNFAGKSHCRWINSVLPKKRTEAPCLIPSGKLPGCRRTKVAQEQGKHILSLCPSPSRSEQCGQITHLPHFQVCSQREPWLAWNERSKTVPRSGLSLHNLW